MEMIVTNDGRRGIAGLLRPWLRTTRYHLFANDFQPSEFATPADFEAPIFDGYAPQVPQNWAGPFINDDGRGTVQADPLTWTVGPGGGESVVYGFWVEDANGYCVFARRSLAPPVPMFSPGATYPMTPRIQAGGLCNEV